MPFESPRLDDKTFDDLVQEALKRIPLYTPEWTDHNLSDPGVTLIELFAYMTDIMLYRLNRVPERHYVKLMELLGMRLREPEAAQGRQTFWLSVPQPVDVAIQQGTEVATTRTENEEPIIFSTDYASTIKVAEVAHILTSIRGSKQREYKAQDVKQAYEGFTNKGFGIFQEKPQPSDAVYFGFKREMTDHLIGIDVIVDRGAGAGINPNNPPYVWEVLSSTSPTVEWTQCELESDGTKAFNVPGIIRLHLPKMVEGQIEDYRGFWLRCRLLRTKEGEPQYRESPHFQRTRVASWGVTIDITHATVIKEEVLGRSDGAPGQKFFLQNTPILKRNDEERLIVRIDGDNEEVWTEVNDFAESGPEDRHYTLDALSGEIRFGPSMPQRDGTIKVYGAIPPKRALIMMRQYRHGGGIDGNLKLGAINTLRTSFPYITRVSNRQPTIGGLNAESVDDAKLRVPGYLRSLERAVTAEDFEYLAKKAAPGRVARAFALPVAADTSSRVNIFIIPQITDPARIIEREDLELVDEVKQMVDEYLDSRRLLTTNLDILAPEYYWIRTKIRIKVSKHANADKTVQAVEDKLTKFINPIIGGPDGTGWPFGRNLVKADIIQTLQDIPGIDFIREIELYWIQYKPDGTVEREGPLEEIDLIRYGVVASFRHDIRNADA